MPPNPQVGEEQEILKQTIQIRKIPKITVLWYPKIIKIVIGEGVGGRGGR